MAHNAQYDLVLNQHVQASVARQKVRGWCRGHRAFIAHLKHQQFEISKGSHGLSARFDENFIAKELSAAGFKEIPFSPAEFLSFWG